MKNQFKKYIKKILCFLLIILIVTQVTMQSYVQAEPIVLTGIALKLFATVLASMGILSFINTNGGVEEFYAGFIAWVEDVKEIANFTTSLITIATVGIINGTKIQVTSLVNLIREYFSTLKWNIISDTPDFDLVTGVIGYVEYLNTLKWEDVYSTGYNYYTGEDALIGSRELINNYVLKLFMTRNKSTVKIHTSVFYNNNIVSNQSKQEERIISGVSSNNDLRIKVLYQYLHGQVILSYIIQDLTTNLSINDKLTFEVSELLGLQGIDEVVIPQMDGVPVPLPVPWGLAMPWDNLVSTVDVLGLNIEELLEVINNIQLEEYLDRLLDLPKSIVDAMNPAEILVEDGVISGINESTWDDVLAEGKEHTDILTRIKERIDVIADTITKYFNPEPGEEGPEKDKTDWGNFKGLFDIFWIFYFLIIIAIIILLKFFNIIMSIIVIPANTALFDSYPSMLSGLNYIKNIKVGGFNVTLQTIFEYMFTVFFFLFIVTTLQKLYHSFQGIERQSIKEQQKESKSVESVNTPDTGPFGKVIDREFYNDWDKRNGVF